ncbi:MAG: PAS domain-containing sensor histidine kinase [Polyangiales bacterium]
MDELAAALLEHAPQPVATVGHDGDVIAASPGWRTRHPCPDAPLRTEVARRAIAAALAGEATSWRANGGRYDARAVRGAPRVGALVNLTLDAPAPRAVVSDDPPPRALQRDLFERAPIGLNLCRMDGLWLESNPAFLDLIGYDRAEADGGLTYWQVTPREYDEAERTQLASLLARGVYGPYEKEFVRKDGTRVPVRLHGFLVERDGERFIWSHIEDLRRERALEAELEAERLRLLRASRLASMGEMTASLAHEINNPLTVIEAYAALLGTDPSDDVLQEAREHIRGAVARIGRLVGAVRGFSRMPDETPRFASVSLRRVAQTAVDLCGVVRRVGGVTVTLDDGADVTVTCDPLAVEQILVNLLNNGMDAARSSAERQVRAQVLRRGNAAVIRVEDSGPGVAPALRARIFDRYFTTKPAGEGTGLGLAISRTLAERHGGTLCYACDDAPAAFELRLPLDGGG